MATAQEEKAIYDYYNSGKMSDTQLADYKSALTIDKSLNLPEGVTIDWDASPEITLAPIPEVPAGLAQEGVAPQLEMPLESELTPTDLRRQSAPEIGPETAYEYANDMMSHDEIMAVNETVRQGYRKMPEGMELKEPESPGLLGLIAEKFQGKGSLTREIADMPYYMDAPEFQGTYPTLGTGARVASHAFSGTDEDMQKIKSDFPDAVFTQDSKNNPIVQYEPDGKKYAMAPPGMDKAQALDLAAQTLAYGKTLGGSAWRSMLSAMGIQAGMETLDVATGGEFDPGQVALAGVAEGVGSKVLRPFTGAPKAVKAAKEAKTVGDILDPVTGDVIKRAGKTVGFNPFTKGKNRKDLARQFNVDEDLLKVVGDNNLLDEIPAVLLSKDEGGKLLIDSLANVSDSELNKARKKAVEAVSKRYIDVIEDLGGKSMDITDAALRSKLDSIEKQVLAQTKNMWKDVRENADFKAKIDTTNFDAALDRILDGADFDSLSPGIQKLVKNIKGGDVHPKTGKSLPDVWYDKKSIATVDKHRKRLVSARMGQDPDYLGVDAAETKILEFAMLQDMRDGIAKNSGEKAAKLFDVAREQTRLKYAMKEKKDFLLGKNMQKSIVNQFKTGFNAISQGDTKSFLKLVNSLPEEGRKETLASGLEYALNKGADSGRKLKSFTDWYEKFPKEHPLAWKTMISNLPKGTSKALRDQYKLSKNLVSGPGKKLTESQIDERMQNVGRALGRASRTVGIYGVVQFLGKKLGIGGFGLVSGANEISKGKTGKVIVDAFGDLAASTEFSTLIKEQSERAAKELSKTGKFKAFWRAIKGDKTKGAAEKWIMSTIQAGKDEEFSPGFTFKPLKIDSDEE